MALIHVDQVTKEFRKGSETIVPLKDAELQIERGQFVSLMGASGTGKSTLLNLIAGIDKPTAGRIIVDGTDITRLSRTRLAAWRARNIGYIFQTHNLIPVLTAYENIELPLMLLPTWDSDMATALQAAGAVLMGKTNVPLGGADFQTYNDLYGTTNNPWDLARTPGGSSGGSAAALAAGFTPLEAGSDIAGSIRNPAHFCGVYGHKPTWGIVSQRGHAPVLTHPTPELDLVVCGPLARTPEDLALALGVMAGPSVWNDGDVAWRLDLPPPTKTGLSEFRVAVWPTDDFAPVDDEIAEHARGVAQALREAGAAVSEGARPDIDLQRSHETYQNLSYSVVYASVPPDEYERNRRDAERYDPNDHSDRAVSARSMVLSHADWMRADGRRDRLRLRWAEFFREWDILICPQMAVAAFEHDHSTPVGQRTVLVNGAPQAYWRQAFWSGLVTAPLLPSTVFPAGLGRHGLPIGLQAVGGAYRDYQTIDFTRLLAKEIGGFQRPPLD